MTNKIETLTVAETNVLRLVGQGWTDKQIAGELEIPTKTVGRHMCNILRKIEVKNRVRAALYWHGVEFEVAA